ncbi:low-affinity phosphate transporter [Nowakowskiella sp. JEL0078]|nr:low-affinity phosphate transporter [Nowakowskiella sp. JEL0078]
MKFSHSLRVNASAEWYDFYIAYPQLKKLLYHLEREELEYKRKQRSSYTLSVNILTYGDSEYDPREPLISDLSPQESKNKFVEALNVQLEKIVDFYREKIDEFSTQFANLEHEIQSRTPRTPLLPTLNHITESELDFAYLSNTPTQKSSKDSKKSGQTPQLNLFSFSDTAATTSTHSNQEQSSIRSEDMITTDQEHLARFWSQSKELKEKRQLYKKELSNIFIVLSELKEYVNLNRVGFGKILKKFDKVLKMKIKDSYMSLVDSSYPFTAASQEQLDLILGRIIDCYTNVAANGDRQEGITRLKQNLHERVVIERSTVWGDMVARERARSSVKFEKDGQPKKVTPSPFGVKSIALLVGIMLFLSILNFGFIGSVEQDGCLAIAILALTLWGFEVKSPLVYFPCLINLSNIQIIPLFTTGLVIPLLIVALRVLREQTTDSIGNNFEFDSNLEVSGFRRLTANEAARKIFSDMWSPVIMLLLGGFSLAAALSKHNIAKLAASWIINKAGNKRSNIIFVNMLVSTFISMWISNVAAPVLCYSLISPVLRTLNLNDIDQSSYAAALVMGIAMSANVGGMASPIASPQNIIAINIMNPPPTWGQWFIVAIPVCICIDVMVWIIILIVFQVKEFEEPVLAGSNSKQVEEIQEDIENLRISEEISPTENQFFQKSEALRELENEKKLRQIYIIGVLVITIALWCSESLIEEYVGDMGVIAIFPLVAFFSFPEILTKEDFHAFPWPVVALAMGGIALGKAVQSSGLLTTAVRYLTPMLVDATDGNVWALVVLLGGIIAIVTSMISHTVGALIILPVVYEIGIGLAEKRPNTLVLASAFMCSGAMALPFSSFPNMAAINFETPTGSPYVQTNKFILTGLLATCIAFSVVSTVGWGLMQVAGFK